MFGDTTPNFLGLFRDVGVAAVAPGFSEPTEGGEIVLVERADRVGLLTVMD